MPDLQKVISGLECCIISDEERECPDTCPYYDECWKDESVVGFALRKDALELLRALQPRVLTVEEVFNYRHNAVWLERRNKRHTTIDVAIFENMENGYVLGDRYHIMREGKLSETWFGDEYNKKWRCWSARPTDEQRKAVAWDD